MGLVSFMGGNANQKVAQSTGNGLLPNGGTSVGGPAKPAVAKMNGGGLAGFLYNNLVQPFANSTANLTSDAAGLVGAGIDATHGKYGKQGMASAYLNSTPVAQAVNATQGGLGKKIEAGVGNVGGDLLNAAAPFVGGEAFSGAKGLGALLKTGAKVGGTLGAAGGAANAASQGGSASDVLGAAGTGGVEGALTGAAGGAVARGVGGATNLVGKLTGKGGPAAADVAGAGADAAAGNASQNLTNPIARTAANYTQSKVVDQASKDLAPFSGLPTKIRQGSSSDGRTGLNSVVKFAKSMNMPTDANNVVSSMHTIHDALTGENGALSGANRQILAGTDPIQLPDVLGDTQIAIGKNAGALGDTGKSKTGAASSALNEVRNVLNAHLFGGSQGIVGDTTHADANDVLDTIQELEKSAANKPDTDTGNAMTAVLKAAASSLEKSLSAGADESVKSFKLAPEDEAAIAKMVEQKGGTPELTKYAIDTANNSGRMKELRSSQALPVRAGELASAADKQASGAIPKPQGGGNAFQGYATGLEAGQVLRGEPTGLLPLAMRYGGKALGATAAKLSKTGAQAGEQLGQEALTGTRPAPNPNETISRMTGGSTPPGTPPTSQPATAAPTTAPPTGNLTKALGRLIGAGTGQMANQEEQNGGAPQTAPTQATSDTTGASDVPTNWVTADQAGPQIDENSIPGGTLAELSQEMQADPKNATLYKDIYDAAQAQVKASIPKAPTAAQAQGATAIQDAFSLIDSVEQEFQSAGGANHAAGYAASLPVIGQHLQPAIYAYNKTKFDAATALAKALSGRAATTNTLKMAMESLPDATDSPQSAAAKLANVRRDLAGKAPNYGLIPAPAGGQ